MVRRVIRWGLLGVAGVILFIILINLWVVGATSSNLYDDINEVPKMKVALLLGTAKYVSRGVRNLFFDYRIKAATELYKEGKVLKIIVSGDNSKKEYDETSDMREALIENGVPEDAIVSDYAGFRTLDSVVRSKSVFGQDSIIIVSQKFHLQRAIYIAQRKNIHALGYIAKDPPHRRSFFKVIFREYFARVKAFLDCYLLGTQPKYPGPREEIVF